MLGFEMKGLLKELYSQGSFRALGFVGSVYSKMSVVDLSLFSCENMLFKELEAGATFRALGLMKHIYLKMNLPVSYMDSLANAVDMNTGDVFLFEPDDKVVALSFKVIEWEVINET